MATTTLDASTSTNRRSPSGRRSTLGAVAAGAGALLFVLALMVHFYVAPALAIAPIDQESVTRLEATGATVFDTATLAPITTDLSITARTTGDVDATEAAGGDARVWTNNTTITSSDGIVRSQSSKRAAFDGKTAEGLNLTCKDCSNFYSTTKDEKVATKLSGLLYKFPFGTEKKTYMVWDDSSAQAVPTKYIGSATVEGIEVYKFENTVDPTVVGDREVPGSLFGQTSEGNVVADSYYSNHTVYYVEPLTGAIVNQVSDTKSWFEYGGNEVVTTEATIRYTEKQVSDMVHKTLGNQPQLLALVQGWIPWAVAVVGLGLLVLGATMSRRRV